MMKKKQLKSGIIALLALVLLASCSNDLESSAAKVDSSIVLDLNNFNYAGAKSAIESGRTVIFKDSLAEIPVTAFKKMDDVNISISGETVNSYEGNDSITVSLSSKFISFRIGTVGHEKGYVSYASATDMNTVQKVYSDNLTASRSVTTSLVAVSSGAHSMKIDLGEAQKVHGKLINAVSSEQTTDYKVVSQEEQNNMVSTVTTRVGGYAFPRNKTVNVYLLIGKNATCPISHELMWQIEKAQKSIKDVFCSDKMNAPRLVFTIQDCDFRSTNDSEADLSNFRTFVRNNSAKYSTGGKNVFFLVRQWWWGSDVLGCAYTDTYNINRLDNNYAFGISQTSCLNATVLAHELGHVFGVKGHSTTPWYRLNKDLMNAKCYPWVGCYHRTDIKQGRSFRNAIYNNLKQR